MGGEGRELYIGRTFVIESRFFKEPEACFFEAISFYRKSYHPIAVNRIGNNVLPPGSLFPPEGFPHRKECSREQAPS